MEFAAQAQYYREHYADTSFDVIVLNAEAGGLDAEAVGRLYVARWTGEIRIVTSPCCPSSATAPSGRRCCGRIARSAKPGLPRHSAKREGGRYRPPNLGPTFERSPPCPAGSGSVGLTGAAWVVAAP